MYSSFYPFSFFFTSLCPSIWAAVNFRIPKSLKTNGENLLFLNKSNQIKSNQGRPSPTPKSKTAREEVQIGKIVKLVLC